MVPALVLAAALGSGFTLELTAVTPEVAVGGEVLLHVVLKADRRTELTPDACGRLSERPSVTIVRDGPGGPVVYHEGPPVVACPITVYKGRNERGGACRVDIVLRAGWTRPVGGATSIDETSVASEPGPFTFRIEYGGLTSNVARVRVHAAP
jgi:hypothetical protein